MSWLAEYGLFIAQLVTFCVVASVVLAVIAASKRSKDDSDNTTGTLKVMQLSEQLTKDTLTLQEALLFGDKKALKALKETEKKQHKNKKNEKFVSQILPLRIVLDFKGDIKASGAQALGRAVSTILTLSQPVAEVIVRLESSGGMVHAYGYAAAQLERLRIAGIHLTVCVDKVAASGGYMMAVVAHTLIAAPYAIVGSIGVIAQLPNFYRLLQKHSIDFEQITAGEHKRTLTMFGENTEEGRTKMTEDIADVHELFKQFVKQYRPQLNLDEVANGDTWFGVEAINKLLVDRLATSDTYVLERMQRSRVLHIGFERKKSLPERFFQATARGIEQAITSVATYTHKETQEK